jgi:hypothetical protein
MTLEEEPIAEIRWIAAERESMVEKGQVALKEEQTAEIHRMIVEMRRLALEGELAAE